MLYHRDPLGVLVRARARHGDVFTLRFAGKPPLVVCGDPAAAADLLGADPGRARAGRARRTVLPPASERSTFGADGADHATARGLVAPGFAQERIAALEPDIARLAAEHVERWPTGRPLRLLPRMRTLASDVFARLVLGIADDARATAMVAGVRRLLWTPGAPPLPVPGEGDGLPGAVVTKVFERRIAPIAALLEAELDDRRRVPGDRGDVLAGPVAAGLSAREVADQLVVVLAAAQEPPAIALANVVLEAAHHPDLVPDGNGDVADHPFVREVLRVRPSAQAVLRELAEPTRVGRDELPAGTAVALSSLLTHRHPTAFGRDPHAFRPDRFAGGVPDGAPYLPFGGGARRCVGEPLARALLRAVLPAVLERRRVRPVGPGAERPLVRGTVLVPHRAALVRLDPR